MQQSPIIGHPTKKSIYLEIEQTSQKSLNIEIKKPKQPRQRTTYIQDFNNINDEVYIHNILNPQY